jgi:uncharacterized protein YqfA (UPF0365 family)
MGTFFKLIMAGIIGIIALSIVFTLVGLAVGLAVLAIKIAIPVLVGVWIFKKVTGPKKSAAPEISEADRKWLES